MQTAIKLAALALLVQSPVQAATVYRCEDPAGRVSFSQLGCGSEQTATLRTANNPSPSSRGTVKLAAVPEEPQAVKPAAETEQQLTVVGLPDDGCGNLLSDRDRRVAILRKEVRPGMTRADVESALGEPDRISGSDARLRYHYEGSPRRTVSFDERGCVPRKRR